MESIVVSLDELGITSIRPPILTGYRIKPDRNLGRGGFRFDFDDFHPKNVVLIYIGCEGKYCNIPLSFNDKLYLDLTFRTKDLCISLIRDSKVGKHFSTDDIPLTINDHLLMMTKLIEDAPPPSQTYEYGDNGRYTRRVGDYFFAVGPNSWK